MQRPLVILSFFLAVLLPGPDKRRGLQEPGLSGQLLVEFRVKGGFMKRRRPAGDRRWSRVTLTLPGIRPLLRVQGQVNNVQDVSCDVEGIRVGGLRYLFHQVDASTYPGLTAFQLRAFPEVAAKTKRHV